MQHTNHLEVKRLAVYLDTITLGQMSVNTRNLYQIILVEKGAVCVRIGDQEHTVASNSAYFLGPGQFSQVNHFVRGTDGYCLSFDIDYFLLCLKNQVKLCFYPFFQFDRRPVLVSLSSVPWKKIMDLVQKIDVEYANRQSVNDDLLTKLYLNILLIEIERAYHVKSEGNDTPQSRKRLITAKFKQLVEKNHMNVRKVSEYADLLTIAPNYLNDVVREATGQSASEIIYERVILEAKARLVQTELTINEIAYQLQFKDSSYFCRFFRKRTGVSPQLFRETNHF